MNESSPGALGIPESMPPAGGGTFTVIPEPKVKKSDTSSFTSEFLNLESVQTPKGSPAIHRKRPHDFLNRLHPLAAVSITPTEQKRLVEVSPGSLDKCPRDTVRCAGRVTAVQTSDTALRRDRPSGRTFQKFIFNRPARHTDRALYDHNVLLSSVTNLVAACTPSAPRLS